MTMRLFLGLAGILFLVAGCGVGPVNNRLYVAEWHDHKRHPIPVAKDWVYEGEHFEHAVVVDAIEEPAPE
jgi:hypothetical protein